jgi:ribose-phosphate pyrophosphokinase
VADLLSAAGANRVVSMDLHSQQIQGFFNFPFDHLTALPILSEFLQHQIEIPRDMVVVSPDAGRVKVAERLGKRLHADLVFIYKRRSLHEANKIEEMRVVGDVRGRPCVMIDDMIDTAGTMSDAARALAAEGAGEIYAVSTHPILSGKAVQRIAESPIKQTIVTNTLPVAEEKSQVLGDRLTVLSIAPVFASALRAVFEDESVSEIFEEGEQP